MNSIICLDCGNGKAAEAQPKEIAKKFGWTYVGKGKWRCPECQKFQNSMAEQFGEPTTGNILIPRRH